MFRFHYIEPIVMLLAVLRWIFLATITGLAVGTVTGFFLISLNFLIENHATWPFWFKFIALPIGGFINGLLIYYGYKNLENKNKDSVITSINELSGKMPYRSLLFKPIAALITLYSGGSAGKTGPSSHIGGVIASWIGDRFKVGGQLSKQITVCGVSAGFASAFGIPIAAAIYGIEVITVGKIRHDYIFPAVVASIVSMETSKFWGVPYQFYFLRADFSIHEILLWKIAIIGILCGFIAWIFIEIFEEISLFFEFIRLKFSIWQPLMPLIGGLILAGLLLFVPEEYFGLGLPLLQDSLSGEQATLLGVFFKIVLVSITIGSGFYGGIVTPQFIIGALAGSSFAQMLNVNPALGAATGLIAVVASASNTPIAAIFIGIEFFGGFNVVYAAIAAVTAYIIIGHRSVHPEQIIAHPKSALVYYEPGTQISKKSGEISYGFLRSVRRWQSRARMFRNIKKK